MIVFVLFFSPYSYCLSYFGWCYYLFTYFVHDVNYLMYVKSVILHSNEVINLPFFLNIENVYGFLVYLAFAFKKYSLYVLFSSQVCFYLFLGSATLIFFISWKGCWTMEYKSLWYWTRKTIHWQQWYFRRISCKIAV